ncbi:hypothetical protein WMF27_20620 [Sorangium sp. So ce281]|uniref:hypothetical protein n=1 Tax=unclassified Sorangium TaxID=2621164 RepID=UPI003F6085B0
MGQHSGFITLPFPNLSAILSSSASAERYRCSIPASASTKDTTKLEPWDPTCEEEIDKLTDAFNRDQPKLDALPTDERERHHAVIDAFVDLFHIIMIYLKGFDEILGYGNERLAREVGTECVKWVKGRPSWRSTARISGIVATHSCSILEEYIVYKAKKKLTPTFISERGAELVNRWHASAAKPKKHDGIRKALMKAIKPSVFAEPSAWAGAVCDVFSIGMAPSVESTLLCMINYRNLYVHEPQSAFKASLHPFEMTAWSKAAFVFAHDLALAP